MMYGWTIPAIKDSYKKFEVIYTNRLHKTKKKYHDNAYNEVVVDENNEGFVCGIDTNFCVKKKIILK